MNHCFFFVIVLQFCCSIYGLWLHITKTYRKKFKLKKNFFVVNLVKQISLLWYSFLLYIELVLFLLSGEWILIILYCLFWDQTCPKIFKTRYYIPYILDNKFYRTIVISYRQLCIHNSYFLQNMAWRILNVIVQFDFNKKVHNTI
jgi:hypothetical protein